MGLFWDLMQQSQISNQRESTASLESRVNSLERELSETRQILHRLIATLEDNFGQDLDGDGRVVNRRQ